MEDKSPSKQQRGTSRTDCSASALSLRRRTPACGGSATTVSTRTTPPGSRPGTEASTRASSRLTSTSRPRVPSVGPSWVTEPEGFYLGPGPAGLADAATASPRAGAPVLHESRHDEAQPSTSTRRNNCWMNFEDLVDPVKAERSSQVHT